MRSRAILDTAAAMLEEMPVSALTLNELSRRVGLAKSNVLRYFDSREAVLLDLLVARMREWSDHLAEEVPRTVRRRAGFRRRAEELAAVLATSLDERPVLCDLISAQASVLEHNVPVEAVLKYKRGSLEVATAVTALVHDALPELDDTKAWQYTAGLWLMVSALWAHACAPADVIAAVEADEALARVSMDLPTALRDYLFTLALGLEAR